jgi:DNA-binding response OmpR family regulator
MSQGIGLNPGTSVMIIDDNQDNIDVLARRLINRDIKVTECLDGMEALEMLVGLPIDIVLCDVMMPGMSGLEVVQRIRSIRSQAALPIIMVSARTDQKMIVDCLQAGANDYVTKPIDFQVVCARIQVQLAIRDTYKAALTDRSRQIRKAEDALARLADAQETIAQLRAGRG